MNDYIYFLENDTTNFIVIRHMENDILEKIEKHPFNKDLKRVLVFDYWNINESLESSEENRRNIIDKINPKTIVIKHCSKKDNDNLFFFKDGQSYKYLDELYITDELYSMSPYLSNIFQFLKTKKLFLKKIKINSKNQLNDFFKFIKKTECEELELDDIFIELLIKEEEDDDELKQYFSYEKGKIILINDDKEEDLELKNLKLKNLKLIDCPLFALPESNINPLGKFFENNKLKKDVSIDIDENSLLNPGIITKLKIKDGLLDICFDLDSYKINLDKDKDYLENLEYIFNIVADNSNKYRKIKFKNIDITKLEYITDNNITKIEEDKWILNDDEKYKKNKYENNDRKIKNIIKNKYLENISELIFDNCTNYFIQLILSMIESKTNINLLKIKKCAKEYFNFYSLYNFNIKDLYLFDTPIIGDSKDSKDNTTLNNETLTIKIVSLNHYCQENNLDFYLVMENIKKLIDLTKAKNICFEMNALPWLMTYLMTSKQYKDNIKINEIKEIPMYFNQSDNFKRINWTDKSDKFDDLKNKNIILRRNNIRNKLENYYYLKEVVQSFLHQDKNKKEPSDYGRDIAYFDEDYKSFFIYNGVTSMTIENSLFTNYKNELKSDDAINKIEKKSNQTITNFISKNIKYKIDIKTLKQVLLKNNNIDDFSHLMKKLINNESIENIKKNLKELIDNKIRFIINDNIEFKEFYFLTCCYYQKDSNAKELEEKLQKYFIKEKNEESDNKYAYTIFNYYYSNEEERKLFNEVKVKTIIRDDDKDKEIKIKDFYIIYRNRKSWEIIFK